MLEDAEGLVSSTWAYTAARRSNNSCTILAIRQVLGGPLRSVDGYMGSSGADVGMEDERAPDVKHVASSARKRGLRASQTAGR